MFRLVIFSLFLFSAFCLSVHLVGCNYPGRAQKAQADQALVRAKAMASRLYFIKDKKTGLCFAISTYGSRSSGIALVDCDDVADHLLTP